MRKLLLLAAVAAGAIAVLAKLQRDHELSEAVWEEPKGL